MEIVKMVGKIIQSLLVQPVWYLAIILAIQAGFSRVNRERKSFSTSIYSPWLELKNLFKYGLIMTLPLSVLALLTGFSVTVNWLIIWNIVAVFLLVISLFRLSSLAISFSIANLIYYICYFYDVNWSVFAKDKLSFINIHIDHFMIAMTFLLAILLAVEAYLTAYTSGKQPAPSLRKSVRGKLVGSFHLQKLWFLPFLAFVPGGEIQHLFSWWPVFNIGSDSYSLIIIPLVFGYKQRVQASLPELVGRRIANQVMILAVLIAIIGAISGVVSSIFTLFAFILAILSRLWITYRFYQEDKHGHKLFAPQPDGLVILGARENSAASRLHLEKGEKITEVNGMHVNSRDDLYRALNVNRAFCKVKVVDQNGEPRFEQTALYENDSFEMGLLLVNPR